jgi:uncharacterized protein YndB with AHSA1/START domain
MLKKIGIVVVVLLVVLIAVIYTRPDEFEVTRSRTLTAPPETVYAQIADFRRWPQWSPWEERDPNMKREFSGAESGNGAKYSWVGNKDVGEGRMTITEAQPTERVAILLEFHEPFAATSVTEFRLAPSGQGTKVDWTMRGENGFPAKAMSLFMNMDKMIGDDFDAGLAKLEKVTAASAVPPIPSGG